MPTNMHTACYLPTGRLTTPELAHLLPPYSLAFLFEHEFVENPRPETNQGLLDTDFMDKIKTPEWKKQMLAWLVRGSMMWYERGTLPTVEELPPAMSKALESYSNDNDHFGNFIMDRCII
jgi:phage/plasmid-associated DNA primase